MGVFWAHKTSLIDEKADIGANTRIWQFCNIMGNTRIGENCNIGQGVFIERDVIIGNRVKIKNNVALYSGVICEDDVFLGPNCVFTNVNNPRSFIEKKDEFKLTLVKKGATIGANATVVCGHIIGRYAFVGAGSVVTRDVSDYTLVMGNPARARGYICQCGERLSANDDVYCCNKCGKTYIKVQDNLTLKDW